jgi:hypothetical protein
MATRKKSGRWQKISGNLKRILFSSQGFPLFLGFTLLSVLFVIFRMKGVEIDYKISGIDKDIEKVSLENKELKAKKARMLSVKNLKSMAKQYKLSQPKQGQILVIR